MFEIGRTVNTSTPEFSIYKMRSPYTAAAAYVVEFDGGEVGVGRTVEETHKLIKTYCRENIIKGAGVTEVFGRNRQFTTTNRYGFKTFKGD